MSSVPEKELISIEDLAMHVKNKLDIKEKPKGKKDAKIKNNLIAIYAFNATGKTRLTNILSGVENDHELDYSAIQYLCYNAFFEDLFTWDNDDYSLRFDKNSWLIQYIIEQGLDGNIVNSFREIIDSNVEPSFNFSEGFVTFNVVSGDNNSATNIKISRGEESVLIWCVFYTVLETSLEELNTKQKDRTTQIFNNLQYIIIDDPVSSIDDTKIITLAIKLVDMIKGYNGSSVHFLIATHHALFYNVIVNSFKHNNRIKSTHYLLAKDHYKYTLTHQGDAPFAYHLTIKGIIEDAITKNNIERYHFNLFRNLLEKTANFLGYSNWYDCIDNKDRGEFTKLLNLYSHSRLSDLESREIPREEKDLFIDVFNRFIKDFKWK
jgi:hypothetical protein